MHSSGTILIETSRASRGNFGGFLDKLRGSWKSGSLLWMQSNGFPVLPGLILNSWTREAEAVVSRFCRERKFSEFLVRVEQPGQRWTRRRGGYLAPVNSVPSLVQELASEGMLTILLEPASPYSDLYSLTSICDLRSGKVDIEVIGPGFDASDILRGDSLPHERFETFLSAGERKISVPFALQTKRLHIVGSDDYRASVRRRLVKIGARLRNPSFLGVELPRDARAPHQSDHFAQDAVQYLTQTGQRLLLDRLTEYEPIPSALLQEFVTQLHRLFTAMTQSRVPWEVLSVAGSFLDGGRLVMWDFFPPGNPDAGLLNTVKAA